MYHSFPLHSTPQPMCWVAPGTTVTEQSRVLYPNRSAMPTESRCAANPPPASRRADPAQAVGANAQVLVNARAAGSCTCRYCGTTPRVYSKSHESLAVSSATSLGFSAMETHFRPHKPAFQESLETRLLLPLAIVRSYLLASTPAAPPAVHAAHWSCALQTSASV